MKVKAADLFDQLNEEEEQEQKKIKVELTPTLDEMLENFKKALVAEVKTEGKAYAPQLYEHFEGYLPEMYSARDIEAFSLLLMTGKLSPND